MGKRNENILKLYWSKKENDLMVQYPRSCDGALIFHHFGDVLKWGGINGKDKGWMNFEEFNLIKELVERGYDKTTLKFEIRLKDELEKN